MHRVYSCLSLTFLHLYITIQTVCRKFLKLSCQNRSVNKVYFVILTFKPLNVEASSSHHRASTCMFEICMFQKSEADIEIVLTKFSLWSWPLTCWSLYVKVMSSYCHICWKLLEVSAIACQLLVVEFSVGIGAFVIGLSQISFFFSIYITIHDSTIYLIWLDQVVQHILTGKRNVTKYRYNLFHGKHEKKIVVHKLNGECVKR